MVENDFNEADVNKFLNEIEIDIKSKNANYLTQTKGSYYNFQRNIYLERNAKKLGKYEAISLCHKNNIRPTNYNSTYACIDARGEVYPANPSPRHLIETWYLLLDDCYNKKLHVLKIPANSLIKNRFVYRDDTGAIVLMVNKNFVDVHPQENIENYLFEHKIATFQY